MHHWDLPMMAKGQTEAQCAKCHQGVVEVPQAASLNAGRFLVERYGCNGCHKIKGWEGLRKVGPDLTHITAKTDPEWMFRWIKEPKGFRPDAHAAGVGRAHRRDRRAEEAERRRDQRGRRLPAVARDARRRTRRRPRATSRPAARRFETDRLPGLPPRGRRQARHGRVLGGVLPHARPEPRRHRQQGQRRLAVRVGEGPEELLAAHAHAEPAAHRPGGGEHHRLPDEPHEGRLPREAAAGDGRGRPRRGHQGAPAGRQRAGEVGRRRRSRR